MTLVWFVIYPETLLFESGQEGPRRRVRPPEPMMQTLGSCGVYPPKVSAYVYATREISPLMNTCHVQDLNVTDSVFLQDCFHSDRATS